MPLPVISLDTLKQMLGEGTPIPWESFTPVSSTGTPLPSVGNPFVSGIIGTNATKIFASYAVYPVVWVVIAVRSFGASTYCRIGNANAQALSLLSATDSIVVALPSGQTFDAAQLFAVCSNGDVTLEVLPMIPAST